jgi:hypothetical protein
MPPLHKPMPQFHRIAMHYHAQDLGVLVGDRQCTKVIARERLGRLLLAMGQHHTVPNGLAVIRQTYG